MLSKEILEKAIAKAIDNGWRPVEGLLNKENLLVVVNSNATRVRFGYRNADVGVALMEWSSFGVIFNNDFARFMWGDENTYDTDCDGGELDDGIGYDHLKAPRWKVKTREMVIADDPIKYLGEHI